MYRSIATHLALLSLVLVTPALADGHSSDDSVNPDFQSLQWRNIGPARGGRTQAVTGVLSDPDTYYMGATGGGVWKTTDRGVTWRNITDGFIKTGSVGDIDVAPSDENVIYLGMGETDIRGNFSHGDGVYKSINAGKTWEHIGLDNTRQIGRIAVHPKDADTVFVAAIGHIFGPNEQRGVFRSTDGGETWEKVLYVDDKTGAVDIEIDPNNPRVLYAGFWQVKRTPWSLESGGEGSGLYRSTDGGDTWEELTEGLPEGIKGKIAVDASPAQRDLVYAMVEADEGGVFKSADGGDTWTRVNKNRKLRQRAWYYTHIFADPNDADTCYVANVRFHKSVDGGRTFESVRVPHVDNHDLWIDPTNSDRLINSNDGGANISYDGGQTWSTQTNQPTAQFYRVEVDNNFPYRVYGGQQDNSTASVSSRARARGNWQRDLYAVGGCESGYVAVHPENPDIVYAGCYGGSMTRYDHETGETRSISVWPVNPMGSGADVLEHRFQWTFPIVISPHNPEKVYAGGERVFVTTNGGASWQSISPDLTTNDKSKQRSSGGPITKDNTSVEYYCTVFTIDESPVRKDLIWVGSDDGLIHVTTDAGENWTNVTPDGMKPWPMISLIDASPHDADTAYAAVTRYKLDDFAPYIYKTTDRGDTWELIVDGIAEHDFVRSVREDPQVPGLLYAATETGVYVSMNAGDSWEPLRATLRGDDEAQLPSVPVTDLKVKDDDLVISTQGRSFWILDDLAPIRQMARGDASDGTHLFAPAPAYRERWDGARVHFRLDAEPDADATLAFYNESNDLIREYAVEIENEHAEEKEQADDEESEDDESEEQSDEQADDAEEDLTTITAEPGMNLFVWNLRHEDAVKVPGAVGWPPMPSGPRVPPGEYEVVLTVDGEEMRTPLTVLPDPRYDTTQSDYDAQYALLMDIHEALNEAHTAVNNIRAVRKQVSAVVSNAKKAKTESEELDELSGSIKSSLKEIENTIIQTKSKSRQDPLNYPIKLNDKIGALAYTVSGDHAPTAQSREAFETLRADLNAALDELTIVMNEDVPTFNALVDELDVPVVVVDDDM